MPNFAGHLPFVTDVFLRLRVGSFTIRVKVSAFVSEINWQHHP